MSIKPNDFSTQTSQEVAKFFKIQSLEKGLSSKDATKRIKKYGPNVVSIKKRWQWVHTLLEPFTNWFVAILIVSAGISVAINKLIEAVVITAILMVNAIIYYVQYISANHIMKSLSKQSELDCLVRRDGRLVKLKSSQLVPGDIVVLREGVKVPTDGRLILSDNLHVDESVLTGESDKQHKHTETLKQKLPIYNQTNMVFANTFVSEGDGEMIVTSTGMNTEFGRIAKLSQKHQVKSPLQLKIDRLTKWLILFVFGVALFTFVLKLFRGVELLEALRFILSLVVSAIPEGLPIAVVVVMVFGVKTMARKNALVRNLSSVETLGQVTLVATDKTGTITKNNLHVAQTWSPSAKTDLKSVIFKSSTFFNGKGDELDELINDEYGKSIDLAGKIVKRLPFVQNKRMSGAVWSQNKTYTTYIKGSAEAIIAICHLSPNAKKLINKQIRVLARDGMRVLAIAAKNEKIDSLKNAKLSNYSFAGLVAFGDELRPRVPQAVERAHMAGIDVILLTGDHKEAAGYFAKLSGISKSQHALNGQEIERLSYKQIRKLVVSQKVFGRVLPEYKFKIINALDKIQITAMTGDGINDVPALRMANVGVAVGSGNDAAKEASDMIVLDNNFATIIDAIEQGRSIVRNVKKILTYILATNLGEIFTIVGALIFGLPLPITALQILWINFVTDSFTMIPLGFEKPEKNLMAEPPRPPSAPLVGKKRATRIVVMATVMATITLTVYYLSLPMGLAYAQTLAFLSLVVAQWANAINSRSDNHSFVEGFKRTNWVLFGGIFMAFIFQVMLMYTGLAKYLNTQRPSSNQIIVAIVVFVLILLTGDALKKLIPVKHISS